ncbi:MAG: TonB-dependent receptor, partial [Bacteroidota bacterium]
MVQFLHRQVAYPHVFVCCLFLFVLQAPHWLYAQEPLQLELVEVRTEKYKISEIGKKLQVLDSGILQQYRFSALSDLLAGNSQVFIKSYGLGASASSGIRGGSANQSALMWKGINIQNAMLGQADLSLIPAFLFNNVKVEYGGSSALWGSGAVAGSIDLDNDLPWNSGSQSNLMLGGGSFGLNQQGFSQTFSGKKILSVSKLYHINSVNNYAYQNEEGITQKLNHANYTMGGFLQDFKWKINERQMLSFNYWMNNNQRKLPSYKSLPSLAMQYDKANRAVLDWAYFKKNYSANVKFAFLQDVLNYNDSVAAVFSKNLVNTSVIESQNYYHYKNQTWQLGLNYTGYFAQTNNYNNQHSLEKVALLMGDQLLFFHNDLKINLALRAEAFNTGAKPITGSVSFDYKLFKQLHLQANVAKIYRQPSLNELYWWPGGQVNLKAEDGYTFEGNDKYVWQK